MLYTRHADHTELSGLRAYGRDLDRPLLKHERKTRKKLIIINQALAAGANQVIIVAN